MRQRFNFLLIFLTIIVGMHVLWLTHLLPQTIEIALRIALAIVTLLTGTWVAQRWDSMSTAENKTRVLRGMVLLGFTTIALNAYFVPDSWYNVLLALLGLIIIGFAALKDPPLIFWRRPS